MTALLDTIRNLSAALAAQDAATTETAEARRRAIRMAVAAGFTYTEIAEATGITRQRVAQLVKGAGE